MTTQPQPRRYQGDFLAWNGGALLIGSGQGVVAPHAHYAIQVVVGAPAGLQMQFGWQGPWQAQAAAIVPSRAVHTIDVSRCAWSAVLFVEPETPDGRGLSARLQGQPEVLPEDAVGAWSRRLERAWRSERSAEAVQSLCVQFVRGLSQAASRTPSDPRVLAAIDYLRTKVDDAVSLADVAAAAHLSPSRFRHLFVAETGMPLRTYVLWRRLLHVWTLLAQGESLAGAAHAAGFADAAHLSRTARTMFGLPPSALEMSGPLSARARTRGQRGYMG